MDSPASPTTPKIRQEIKDSGLSDRQAGKVFNITRSTAAKWLKRDDVQDRSHRAHTLHTTLSAAQEAIVLALRQSLYLPLDDLLFITKQYINSDVSRSRIARLLKREGMARLEDVIPKAEGETVRPKKTFKDYEPGFLHIDIKYLPQMPDELGGYADHQFSPSTDFDLIAEGGKRLPPKAVFGVAAKLALGFEILRKHFTAGVTSICFRSLSEACYPIVPKNQALPETLPSLSQED